MGALLAFFKTRPDKPQIEDPSKIKSLYTRKRWSVFLSLLIGYSFFYVCRQVFSVVKKPMINEGFLNADEMGRIGSAMLITYAVGKFTNGFLADRANISRFMATGLLSSALIVILLGFKPLYFVFLLLWGLHGWTQSMGAAPAGASLSHWFSNRERGTLYGFWSTSHSIGEGLSFAITATVVAYFGWRFGFWGAGAISLLVALALYITLADRPQTYGLPAIADYKNDHAENPEAASRISVRQAQLEVIKNPYVWIIGFSSMAMYVARYGVNSWGILYLQEAKHYPLIAAGLVLSFAKISETIGTLACGLISDRLFGSRRNVTTLMYGLLMIGGLAIFWQAPGVRLGGLDESVRQYLSPGPEAAPVAPELAASLGQYGIRLPANAQIAMDEGKDGISGAIQQPFLWFNITQYRITDAEGALAVYKNYQVMQLVGASCFAFGVGGLLAFLGGLIAIDICSKKASGAAMGFVGLFSYIGASIQERVSGALIERGKMVVDGQTTHDFSTAITFWFCAACASVLLYCLVWNAKPRD